MSGLSSIYEQAFAPKKDKDDSTKDKAAAPTTKKQKTGEWGFLQRSSPPGDKAPEVKKARDKRKYPTPSFTLTRVTGPSGRSSYELRQKVQVLDFSRLICDDGEAVGKRGAATVFGIDVRLLRAWSEQEKELRQSFLAEGSYHVGRSRSLNTGRQASTHGDVEESIVDEINTLGNGIHRANVQTPTALLLGHFSSFLAIFARGLLICSVLAEDTAGLNFRRQRTGALSATPPFAAAAERWSYGDYYQRYKGRTERIMSGVKRERHPSGREPPLLQTSSSPSTTSTVGSGVGAAGADDLIPGRPFTPSRCATNPSQGNGVKRPRHTVLADGAAPAAAAAATAARCVGAGAESSSEKEVAGPGVNGVAASAGGVARTGKRTDFLVWDDYFMSVAFLSAMRSKDPSTQVGACIVNEDRRIVGIGYNGFPMGCSDDDLPWARQAGDELDTKYPYVCHAEMNAILNKNSADVKGCLIYVALFPCNECAKLIIQSGIREVVYLSDKYHETTSMKASRRLFDLAGVKCRQHVPSEDKITIDFSSVRR
ncbi:unnamed protein product [Pylaiella littoralis]